MEYYRHYQRIRSKKWLNTLVILTRLLVGFSFIPSGLKKILGDRFTDLPVENPVGFLFEALYRTGLYWNFLGATQLFTAFLLMTQRFTALASILFFGVSLNIWFITVSMGFEGTVYITTLLLLAALLLLIWDFDRLKILVRPDFSANHIIRLPEYSSQNYQWRQTGFTVFILGIAGSVLFTYWKGGMLSGIIWIVFMVSLIAIRLWRISIRQEPVTSRKTTNDFDEVKPT